MHPKGGKIKLTSDTLRPHGVALVSHGGRSNPTTKLTKTISEMENQGSYWFFSKGSSISEISRVSIISSVSRNSNKSVFTLHVSEMSDVDGNTPMMGVSLLGQRKRMLQFLLSSSTKGRKGVSKSPKYLVSLNSIALQLCCGPRRKSLNLLHLQVDLSGVLWEDGVSKFEQTGTLQVQCGFKLS